MTAATTTTEPEAPDLDAIEADAQAKIEALEDQRQRLAPEALVSATAKAELADCESELGEVKRALELVALARQEDSRREAEAIEAEEAERRAKALSEARKLQPKREAAARAVDATADKFAAAMSAWAAVRLEQEVAFDRAGERFLRPAGSAVEAALVRAMFDNDCPLGVIEFGGIAARPCPLTESEPSQPLGEDE
jgi:hypothetical protein